MSHKGFKHCGKLVKESNLMDGLILDDRSSWIGKGASNDSGVVEKIDFQPFRAFGRLGNEANIII